MPRDKRVRTVEQLTDLAYARRAVYAPQAWMSKPIPAAVMLNMSAAVVCRLISRGLFVYTAKGRRKKAEVINAE